MLATRVGGHIALIGVLSGVDTAGCRSGSRWGRQLRLLALVVGSRRQQQGMIRALEVSELRPVIDRHYPLEELVAAFQHQASGRHFGKIALDL